MNTINKSSSNFENKIDDFKEVNQIKNNSLNLIEKIINKQKTLEKYNFELLWEEVMNALLVYDKKIMEILFFETSNWKNKQNNTSKTIKLSWMWRFSIFNFINIAKEKWLEKIKFDIMLSEIWFYKKIESELKNSNLIKSSEIDILDNKNYFIIKI